jgi:hypothetical protein
MKPKEPEPPLLVDRPEAARLLGVSVNHLGNLEKRGVLTPVRLGAPVLHRRADIDRLAAEDRGQTPQG